MSAAAVIGPDSWTRRLSPWRWMPAMVAGQVLRGLPDGSVGKQRDGARRERDEHVAGQARLGDREREVVAQPHHVLVGPAAVEVEADQPGDVVGARLGGDGGGVALLHDRAVLDDDEPVGQHERVERIVRDEQRRARVLGEMALQLGAGVEAGTGVQRGQRLVEQQQRRVAAASARASATRWACPPESWRGLRRACSARPTRPSQSAASLRASLAVRRRGGGGRTRRCPSALRCGKSR